MLLVGGTLLAWAVSLRLLSNALFLALAAYVQLWLSTVLWLLRLVRVHQPEQQDMQCLQQETALVEYAPTLLQHQQQYAPTLLQHQQSPLRPPALAEPPFEQATQHATTQHEHIHSWVQSAALAAAHASPPGSTCPSASSPRPAAPAATTKEPLCQESSSSSMASTGAAVSTAIVQAAAQGMLQAYSMKDTRGKLHAAAPAAVAAWATAAVLASRVSESSSCSTQLKGRRASTANVCLPPLEYEASAELQKQLDAAAPHEFICPIGRVLMVDPVFTPSGFTYQRSSILDWIARTGRDPAQDGSPLSPSQLCPNVNLRDQIATWLQRQGVAT